MQNKFDNTTTPPSSPRSAEAKRLRAEAQGSLAPVKKGTVFEENRNRLINERVAEGLRKFDEQQAEDPSQHLSGIKIGM